MGCLMFGLWAPIKCNSRSHLPSGVLFCIDLSLVYLQTFFGFLPYFFLQTRLFTMLRPLHAALLSSQHAAPPHSSGVG